MQFNNLNRRDFLQRSGGGFGGVALAALLAEEARAASEQRTTIDPLNPLAERLSHVAPRAKQVVFLFQYGGPSTFDLIDYKPELIKLNGQPVPESFKKHNDKVGGVLNHCKDELMSGPWKWAQHGESGLWFSDLLPHTSQHADELFLFRSMYSDSSNHAPATYLMNTGSILSGKPSMGSWVTYGLGSLNQNLPGYVLLIKLEAWEGRPTGVMDSFLRRFKGLSFVTKAHRH